MAYTVSRNALGESRRQFAKKKNGHPGVNPNGRKNGTRSGDRADQKNVTSMGTRNPVSLLLLFYSIQQRRDMISEHLAGFRLEF